MEPNIQNRAAFNVAGTTARYNVNDVAGISPQWDRFAPSIGKVPGQVGWTCYGVCSGYDDAGNFDYLCGVEVTGEAAGFVTLAIPEHQYAVFTHRQHISKIKDTWTAAMDWLPKSSYKAGGTPDFEVYDQRFNAQTGDGEVEIWISVTDK